MKKQFINKTTEYEVMLKKMKEYYENLYQELTCPKRGSEVTEDEIKLSVMEATNIKFHIIPSLDYIIKDLNNEEE